MPPLTLVQIAEKIGIPRDSFEELIQLPIVARAITVAADKPSFPPSSVWKAVGRPTLWKNGGLDIEALEVELAKRLELATRSDGKIVDQRLGYPVLQGRAQKAEAQATRRLAVIERVYELMKNHYAEPSSMQEVKDILTKEIQVSGRNYP